MISGPLISVVIPAYNCAEYVVETIESVKNQTYFNWEIIFVNDGSTDETPRVLEELAESDTRIRVVHQENGKQGKARNNGIKHAAGEWIAFLDADDLWPEKKLELQLERTLKAKVDMSFTNGYICLHNDMSRKDTLFGVEDKVYSGKSALQEFHLQNKVPTSSVLIKKSILDIHGKFPEELEIQNCEDYLLWTSLLEKGCKLLGIKEPYLFYRVHVASSTGSELKLLFPLLNALMIIPGKHLINQHNHLEKTFFRFLTLLQEQDKLREGRELIIKVIPKLYPRTKSLFLKSMWKLSLKVGKSATWRLR